MAVFCSDLICFLKFAVIYCHFRVLWDWNSCWSGLLSKCSQEGEKQERRENLGMDVASGGDNLSLVPQGTQAKLAPRSWCHLEACGGVLGHNVRQL
jgi:hypothetical protein